MPTYARQGITFLLNRKNTKSGKYIVFVKKTGYANVRIGDQHIYWDNTTKKPDNVKPVNFDNMIQDYKMNRLAKKQIVVRRV